jgi:IclR family pca regulon transcriptional regulator
MARSSAPAERDHPLFVASIAKCFDVLEALNATGRAVGLTELAALAGEERSAVQRITHTLKTLGYLRQHPQTRAFTIAGRMLDFGHTVLATDRVRAKAYPFLERLNASTGETVNLMELEGNDIVCVARFPSAHPVSVDLHVGSRLPAFCTAAGRAILSHLPEAEALARLAAAPRKTMTAHTVTDLPGLKRRLADARRLGYALNDQEAYIGDVSVAAALVDRAGRAVGAINIAVPSPRWRVEDVRRKLAPKVAAAAREIGAELGVL